MVVLLPLLPQLSLLSLLCFTFTLTSITSQTTTNIPADYLKLQLLHTHPFPSPSQALISSDTHRISSLLRHHTKLPLTSAASSGSGQYLVHLLLGSPPQPLLLVADTGSDLIWATCSACRNCSSRPPSSAFLPRHSSSFSPHHCYNSACQLVPHPESTHCSRTRLHSPCRYEYTYSDGSLTSGFFSREKATFNSTVEHHSLSFGCGFHVTGPSVTGPSFKGAQGVMGLGRGPISLPSQLGRRFGNKFSYCLMDYTLSPTPTSYLLIGGSKNATVSRKMSYTPLQTNALSPTFYYIGIESVHVGKSKLRISPSVWAVDRLGNGGTVVDSGTTLTFLADPAYRRILAAFKRLVKLPPPSKPTPLFDMCVNVTGVLKLNLPKLGFRLAGGSLFLPPAGNYFLDTAEGVKCLALQPSTSSTGFSVIGNLMQQGFLFEFDTDGSRLGFTRHGCGLP
ncbi:hypothetical protein RJ640_017892 [Escallonia rubra]|uniref:Peptidase A1 domain-containing protein n=1 Tax=Escallonia rubra TaxID=112253 RepID=A0AA88QKE3_9ASTE|nr:hypothetical protein RJ640_017892 [Escallonia rubra]